MNPVSATTLSLTLCPLTAVTTEATTPAPIPPEPIPLTTHPEPEPITFAVSKPGVISARSETSYTWLSANDSAVSASIEIARS